MFRKCFKAPLLVLLALVMHLFVGQHDSSSALILCLGDDGHVAIEMAQHPSHPAQIEQAGEHLLNACPETENCQDIVLAFDHQEIAVKQEARPLLLPLIFQSLLTTVFPERTEPEFYAFRLSALSQGDLSFRDLSSQSQTLKHTILII